MPDDVSDIAAYYNSDPEREHARLERHQLESDLTWRYLDKYLPPAGKILEIGAATGKYTQILAQRGYFITAVDMSAALLAECQRNLEQAGLGKQVRLVEADVRHLEPVPVDDFDVALLMGPLYHLVELGDRVRALQEVVTRLRTGGILFSSFISRYGILSDLIIDHPAWIEDQTEVRSIIERGKRPEYYPKGGFRGYFARADEIVPLHEELGLETLVLAGVEPVIAADDGSYNQLEGKPRRLWFDLLFELSTEKSILGASRHLLYIGKKK
jgi:S-adenosylmethionine-dependent methyltransferase